MSLYQRDAVIGTALHPVLDYREIGMERHLALAVIKSWIPRRKAFTIAGKRIPFPIFDVVFLTGLHRTRLKV